MKSVLMLCIAATLIVPVAVAGEMTPEQIMQKFMSCPSCAPYMEYPEFQTGLQFDTQKTADGMLVLEIVTDKTLVPRFRECEEKLDLARAEVAKLSPAEAEEKLCPFCAGFHKLMSRGDIDLEDVELKMGSLTMASAGNDEGIAALHAYVDEVQKINTMLESAAQAKEPPK